MQKKQSKNSRRNIGKTWKMWCDKSAKKIRSNEENYQEGSWRRRYMGGQTRDMIRNIRED